MWLGGLTPLQPEEEEEEIRQGFPYMLCIGHNKPFVLDGEHNILEVRKEIGLWVGYGLVVGWWVVGWWRVIVWWWVVGC